MRQVLAECCERRFEGSPSGRLCSNGCSGQNGHLSLSNPEPAVHGGAQLNAPLKGPGQAPPYCLCALPLVGSVDVQQNVLWNAVAARFDWLHA